MQTTGPSEVLALPQDPGAPRRTVVARILAVEGVLLLAVAMIHLVMTSELGHIVALNTNPRAYAFIWPPYALDHVAVGILLVPVGLAVIITTGGIRSRERRAWWIALVNAIAIFALSPTMALTVGLRYFADAPAFLVAAVIVAIVGIAMIVPLLWIRKDYFAA